MLKPAILTQKENRLEVTNIVIDPKQETDDVNVGDNVFPKKATGSKFDQLRKN